MTVHDLPAVNATLNGSSAILLIAAYFSIKKKRVHQHAYLMIAALVMSSAFLTGYLIYHYNVGTTRVSEAFPQVAGWLRGVYLLVLFPHLTLAIVMLPMIGSSLYLAYHRRWAAHKRISPWSLGIWLYVSITGVIIYWMLYHLFPGIQASAAVATR